TAFLLAAGQLLVRGLTEVVLERYYASMGNVQSMYSLSRILGDKEVAIRHIALRNSRGIEVKEIPCGEDMTVEINLAVRTGSAIPRPWIGIRILSALGDLIAHIANREAGYELKPITHSSSIICQLHRLNLLPGHYYLDLVIADVHHHIYDRMEGALSF